MAAIRFSGQRALFDELVLSGDTVLVPESFLPLTTVGSATVVAGNMMSGVLYRTGPTGAYTDTFDTTANVLTALAGNMPAGALVPGLGFKLRVVNSVAFAATLAYPTTGYLTGSGPITAIAASTWRDLLFTFNNIQAPISSVCNITNGSNVVTWALPAGTLAALMGPASGALNITPGCNVSGTGIPANTTVTGVTQGQGGTLGFTMSGNASSSSVSTLTFSPTITVSTSGSGTL